MYTITLADGRKIANLELNGNNFISETEIDEQIFKNNLSTMSFTDGEQETIMNNVELCHQFIDVDEKYHLVFREIPQKELDMINLELALTEVYEMILGE